VKDSVKKLSKFAKDSVKKIYKIKKNLLPSFVAFGFVLRFSRASSAKKRKGLLVNTDREQVATPIRRIKTIKEPSFAKGLVQSLGKASAKLAINR